MENYITIKQDFETEELISKSRFITYLFKVEDEEEAKKRIAEIKSLHKSANHNCSAYTIGDQHQIQKASDDGEPSGTAGVPMLETLKKKMSIMLSLLSRVTLAASNSVQAGSFVLISQV